ncbi:MAG: SIMPL domain-containing protein [Thermoanaerobacteraceae bacterium]|nr:SIMPL domain-containing protein [Thermoanaerobacteraceae bacterium]
MSKRLYYTITVLLIALAMFGFVLIFNATWPSTASADETKNVITVNGEGVIKVKPDMAYVNMGVETINKTAKEAQDKNADAMNKLIQALKGLGITEDDIKTTNYSIYPEQYYDDKTNQNIISGYHVTNMVEVTVRDINNVGNVIDSAGESGANRMYNVRFTISDDSAYYQQALKIAAKNAKDKAEGIAKGLGVNLGAPVKVIEQSSGGPIVYNNIEYMKAREAATPISSGELEITAQITVDYSF